MAEKAKSGNPPQEKTTPPPKSPEKQPAKAAEKKSNKPEQQTSQAKGKSQSVSQSTAGDKPKRSSSGTAEQKRAGSSRQRGRTPNQSGNSGRPRRSRPYRGKKPYKKYQGKTTGSSGSQARKTAAQQQSGAANTQVHTNRLLRRPSVKRMLKRERPVLGVDEQQRKVLPSPVRAAFTEGVPLGRSRGIILPFVQSALTPPPAYKPVEKKSGATQARASFVENDTRPQADENETNGETVVSKLLINAEEPEESRIALLENGRLESLQVSTVNLTQTKNNIYKARVVAVEPNLQAAFVDYGTEKNGFLPFGEIHPEYYKADLREEVKGYIKNRQWKKFSITDVVEKGQELLVQVVKEEIGKKGANMTTYLSLPGRCVVLMPGSDSTGVSRKISGEGKRTELRDIMKNMGIPSDIGWIVRTASIDITEAALSRDVEYLLRLWDEIKKRGQDLANVGLIYEDHHVVLRFLREHFDPSIQEILVDDEQAMRDVQDFIELLPRAQRDVRVRLHKGSRPIFNQFSVEDQIESIYQPQVNLPSGGSIVIDPTEALVAIDVNSGSTSKSKNFEASIFQANMEAATELARQLRLRDLGGLIVVDFIDMRSSKNIRDVEKQVKQAMKRDKAKVDFSRISKFGLMEISRQKLGSPLAAGTYRVCEHCKGRGVVRSIETLALFYLRRIQTGASRKNVSQVEGHFPLDVAGYLLNNKRHEIHEMERKYDVEIIIVAEPAFKPAQNEITLHKLEKEEKDQKKA